MADHRVTIGALIAIAQLGAALVGCSDRETPTSGLSPQQLAAQVREAFAEPLHIDRMTRLAQLVAQLDAENVGEVSRVFDEHVAGLSGAEVRIFISAWSQWDEVSAHAFAEAIPFATQREQALAVVVHDWAVRNPLDAQAVAEALVLPGRNRAANPLERLVKGWVHQPDTGLEDYLQQHPELVSAVVQEVYRVKGLEGLIGWTENFIRGNDDPDQCWQAFRKTVRTLGLRAPEAATDWVSEHYGRGEYARDGPRILTESWARRDTISALEWLRTRAPEQARAEALASSFLLWLSRDGAKAREWLDSRPDERFYDPAYAASAKAAIRSRDPESAIQFCERIPPSDLKQSCLHGLASKWYRFDPVAAGAWMESSSLDPELRDSVRAAQQRLGERNQR